MCDIWSLKLRFVAAVYRTADQMTVGDLGALSKTLPATVQKLVQHHMRFCEIAAVGSRYRTADEMTRWRARDPVTRFQNFLLSKGWWDAKQEKELRMSLRKEVHTKP